MPGSQKFSQNFNSKILSNFLMVFGVSLEMQSASKTYVSVQDDEITELVHTIKSACAWHLFTLASAVRDIKRIATEGFFWT